MCLFLLVLCVCVCAAAEAEGVDVEIPAVQAGQETSFVFTYEEGSISSINYGLYEKDTEYALAADYINVEGTDTYQINIDGLLLQPGEYEFRIRYYPADSSGEKTTVKSFTIAEGGQPAKPAASLDTTDVLYSSDVKVSLASTGYVSQEVAYQYTTRDAGWAYVGTNQVWAYNNEFSFALYNQPAEAGAYDYQIRFSIRQDGIWSPWSDPVDFSYIYYGRLAEPVITVASGKNIGEDIPFSFVCDHAEAYIANLYRVTDTGDDWITNLQNENGVSRITGTSGTIVYPILEAGTYALQVNPEAAGYVSSIGRQTFTVAADTELSAGPQVTLNNGGSVYAGNLQVEAAMADLDRISYEIWNAQNERTSSGVIYAYMPGAVSFYPWPGSAGETYTLKVCGHANGRWTQATEVTYTVQERQVLPEPVIALSPDLLEAGMDLTVSFEEDPLVRYYTCNIEKENADGSWTSLDWRYLYPEDTLTATLSGYYLLDAGNYRINYWSYPISDEYAQSDTVTKTFTVTAGSSQKVSVSLEERDEYYIHQSLRIDFDQTYDELRVLAYQEDSLYFSESEYDASYVSISFSEAGSYQLKATAKKNGKWLQLSDVIPVVITSRGTLEKGSILFDAENLQPGYDLTVSVEMDARASSGDFYLRKKMNPFYWSDLYYIDLHSSRETITISGANLTAGDYELYLRSYAEGYESAENTVSFTLTGTLDPGPKVTVPENVYIDTEARYSLSLEGATEVNLRWYYNRFEDADNYYTAQTLLGNGEFSWSRSLWIEGTWGVRASAKVNGRWTDWGELVTFEVTSKGTLAAPEITLPDGAFASGQDLEIRYVTDDRAEYGNIFLYQQIDGNLQNQLSKHIPVPDGLYSLPGYLLGAGSYRVEIYLYAQGYKYGYAKKEFTVTGQDAAGPTVTLDKDSYLCGEPITITLDRTYDAVCVSGDWSTRVFYHRNKITWNTSYGSEGFELRVKTQTGGAWSQWTTLTVPVQALGELVTPKATILNADLAEDIQIQIGDVEHAQRYRIEIRDSSDNYIASATLLSGGTASFDEALFRVGTYEASIWVYGTGYSEGYTDLSFDVTGSRSGPLPEVTPSATVLQEGEQVSFEVVAPGAALVRMMQNDSGYYELFTLNNGRATIVPDYMNGDVVPFRFAAQTDGKWSEWTDPIVITMEYPEPEYSVTLSDPVITLSPENRTTGNDLNVSMIFDTKATDYSLELLYKEEDDWYGTDSSYFIDRTITDPGRAAIVIPGSALSRSGYYTLEVWAHAPNARSSYTSQQIHVSGTTLRAPAPTVTYDVPSDTVYASQPVQFTVSTTAGTISALRGRGLRTGSNGNNTWNFGSYRQGSSIQTGITFGDYYAGCDLTFSISAKIDGVWSEYSEEHTFHVIPNLEILDYPVPTLSAASVTAGETITVTWPKQDSRKVKGLYVEWYNDSTWGESGLLDSEATSFTVDTSDLPEGTYRLYIWPELNEGYGYNHSVHALFTVREAPSGDLTTLALPAGLRKIEAEAFAGTNAQRIIIPAGCTEIGSKAFAYNHSLVSVVIPASVTSIAHDAFLGCEDIIIETPANSDAAVFAGEKGFGVILK